MKLNLALAQINTHLGDLESNLETHLEFVDQAIAQNADLIIFPELSLTGYVLQDLTPSIALQPESKDPIFGRLLEASKKIDLLVGFVERDARQRHFISAAYLAEGNLIHVHRKVYLPTYGLFDEGRFFAAGERVSSFETRFGRFGVLICEDFWHASPPYLLWVDGAEMLIFISASPGKGLSTAPQLGSALWVERIMQAYASLFTTFVVHTNRVGFEDGLNFWGGAAVFDPDGREVAHGPYYQESLVCTEIDFSQLRRTRTRLPLLRDEKPWLVRAELERILSLNS
jgi:NAD+ synthase (glutamine-hydrolysing)